MPRPSPEPRPLTLDTASLATSVVQPPLPPEPPQRLVVLASDEFYLVETAARRFRPGLRQPGVFARAVLTSP